MLYAAQKDKIRCLACARYCEIENNSVGYCGVRYFNGKDLEVLNYGKFLFLKKRKEDLLVGSIGSNMRFSFDMDWDSSLLPHNMSKVARREEVNNFVSNLGYEYSPEELIEYAKKKECNRVVFQFNEPIVYIEYVLEVAKSFDVKIVSNGYFSNEVLQNILKYISNLDILLYSTFDKFYFKHSRAQLGIIRENVCKIYEGKKEFRILCPLIEGENDDYQNIENISKFIKDLSTNTPLVFKKYYPSYRMLDKEVTSDEKMEECKKIALKIGLQNVILEE